MKKVIFFFIFGLLLFSSCKKDHAVPVDLAGTTFKGAARVNDVYYNPFSLVFTTDTTALIVFDVLLPFPGKWSKTSNSRVIKFTFDEGSNKWEGEATLNSSGDKLENGTLFRSIPSPMVGTFTADKQ